MIKAKLNMNVHWMVQDIPMIFYFWKWYNTLINWTSLGTVGGTKTTESMLYFLINWTIDTILKRHKIQEKLLVLLLRVVWMILRLFPRFNFLLNCIK
jgi:hypothetical protein